MSVEYLNREGAPRLAYQKDKGNMPGVPAVLFLHGLWSDMGGTKASFLAERCAERGQTFLRFDFRGHGQSGGDFRDATIGGWFQDALDMIDHLTEGPLILVGSSMGGWISFLAARERSNRLGGLIGLAAAPDFTVDIEREMSPSERAEMQKAGQINISHNPDFPCIITRNLLEEGASHCLLSSPIPIACPVRLIQGMKDEDVPWQTAHRISNMLTTSDKKVYLREEGDHRLSSEEDLYLLAQLVKEMSSQ